MTLRFLVAAVLASAASGCASCTQALQEKAVRTWALGLCDELPHESGASCGAEVERRLPLCDPQFLAQAISPREYMECLGFDLPPEPPEPIVLGECDEPLISMEFYVYEAKKTHWGPSEARVIDGRTLYVSNSPAISTADLRRIRLEDQDFGRFVVVLLSDDAAGRFEATTRANIGEPMILSMNGVVSAPTVTSAISGAELAISAPGASIGDFCRSEGWGSP